MSLTSLLNNEPRIKALFAGIPNVKSLIKSDLPTPFTKAEATVPRLGHANPVIGHAYDYFLRAYVQRINGVHQEKEYDDLAAAIGVQLLAERGINANGAYMEIVDRRNQYILGHQEFDVNMARDTMILANLENYYRSGTMGSSGTLAADLDDIADLLNLATATEKHRTAFLATEGIVCNPTFGQAVTELIDGADGDLIIDDMLIDIKTESTFGYKISHWRQLIGYWILSTLSPSYSPRIQRLGIWNPRYCRLAYVALEDLIRAIDMAAFTDQFISIITDPGFEGRKYLMPSERQRYIQEVQGAWASAKQQYKW